MKIKSILFFANGNSGVFNDTGEQLPEFQQPWHLKFLEWLEKSGGEFERDKIEIRLPTGERALLFKTSGGDWNWDIKP